MDDLISGRSPTFLTQFYGLWREILSEELLSEAGFARIGSVGATCFVDDFVSGWSKRGANRFLLEPT